MADILRSGLEPEGPRNTTECDKRNKTVTHINAKRYGFLPLSVTMLGQNEPIRKSQKCYY
jgi:hypothetical protein